MQKAAKGLISAEINKNNHVDSQEMDKYIRVVKI